MLIHELMRCDIIEERIDLVWSRFWNSQKFEMKIYLNVTKMDLLIPLCITVDVGDPQMGSRALKIVGALRQYPKKLHDRIGIMRTEMIEVVPNSS